MESRWHDSSEKWETWWLKSCSSSYVYGKTNCLLFLFFQNKETAQPKQRTIVMHNVCGEILSLLCVRVRYGCVEWLLYDRSSSYMYNGWECAINHEISEPACCFIKSFAGQREEAGEMEQQHCPLVVQARQFRPQFLKRKVDINRLSHLLDGNTKYMLVLPF